MKHKCLNPVSAWRCGHTMCKQDSVISPRFVFSESEALKYFTDLFGSAVAVAYMRSASVAFPCGRCAACQIRKRKDWTVRLSNERSMYDDDKCVFITLTYNDDSLVYTDSVGFRNNFKGVARGSQLKKPYVRRSTNEFASFDLIHPTLFPQDVQKFIKRLRRHLEYLPDDYTCFDKVDVVSPHWLRKGEVFKRGDRFYQCLGSEIIARDHLDTPIRYFVVGEYGSKGGRPHYHLLILGWRPSDLEVFKSYNGHLMYRSKQIEKLWTYGFSTVEDVGVGVARYVSRYVTKKFVRLSELDDSPVHPEFILQSVRNGGIGSRWFDENMQAIFDRGFVSLKCGDHFEKFTIPMYYWSRLRKSNLAMWLRLRDEKMWYISTHRKPEDVTELVRVVESYYHKERSLVQNEFF